jgi:carbamoyl-phosphate synthase large subunit
VLTGAHPNVVDVIMDGTVQCVINIPEGLLTGSLRDGFYIRRAAAEKRIPCFTSIDTARAAVEALAFPAEYDVATVREYVEA